MQSHISLRSWLVFLFLAIVWGSAYMLMKKALEAYTAIELASLRLAIASTVLLPFVFRYIPKIPKNKIGWVFLAGIIGNGIPAFLFAKAGTMIDSNLSGILNALTPVFILIIGAVFFKIKATRIQTIGFILGFAGVCLLFISKGKLKMENMEYCLLVVLATLMYALNVNMIRTKLKGISSIHLGSVSIAFTGLFATIYLLTQDIFHTIQYKEGASSHLWYILILAVLGTAIANIAFYFLIKETNAEFASMTTYAMPVVSIGWGLLLGETITIQSILCLGFILAGVYLVSRRPKVVVIE